MTKIKKYKNAVERFLSGESGQRFFNFAYSIGAAIVIWGALFKILHLPGGNTLLCIGMGTEVLMFILTAFDRPAKQYHWEEVFPELSGEAAEAAAEGEGAQPRRAHGGNGSGGGTVVIGGGSADGVQVMGGDTRIMVPGDNGVVPSGAAEATDAYVAQVAALCEQMGRLRRSTEELNRVSDVLLQSYHAITENSDRITESSTGYVEEMTSLNRNIAGLNTIYEIQLKSVSSQLDSIDRVNRGIKDIRDMYEKSAETSRQYCEETERMAVYMKQLNDIYAQMIEALKVRN